VRSAAASSLRTMQRIWGTGETGESGWFASRLPPRREHSERR